MNDWQPVLRHLPDMLWGLRYTVFISVSSLVLAMVIGLLVVQMWRSQSRAMQTIAFGYVQVFRALSPYVYILLIYFALAGFLGWNMDAVTAAIIALTLLNSAYIAEIYRGALLSVDSGQWEASKAIGLTEFQTNRIVVWPQALRVAVPSLLNQFIIILKDSSIVGVIGVKDILYVANAQATITYKPFEYLTVVGFVFITIVFILSRLSLRLEARLKRGMGGA
jgi:His/Glu/Gln/Arg/opine family amino acid ABC transporter permease subunit